MSLSPPRRLVRVSSGTVTVTGLKELEATLLALSAELATSIGKKATKDGAQVFAALFKAKAPYRLHSTLRHRSKKQGGVDYDYGHLRDDITVKLGRSLRLTTVNYQVGVGAAFWGYFQEFGTRKQPAYPWMRPAFDLGYLLALKALTVSLTVNIDMTARRLANSNGARVAAGLR